MATESTIDPIFQPLTINGLTLKNRVVRSSLGGRVDFYDGATLETLSGPRHPDGAAHGSGCTHSSALAAHLALGDDPLTAARHARDIASEAVHDGLRELGAGPGPVDVFGLRHRSGVGATEASRSAPPLA